MLRSKSTLAWGSLQRAVSNVKFYQNLSSSIGDVGGRNLPSCISLATGLYNCLYYLLYSHDKHSVQECQTSQTWCMFNFRPDASSCLHTIPFDHTAQNAVKTRLSTCHTVSTSSSSQRQMVLFSTKHLVDIPACYARLGCQIQVG